MITSPLEVDPEGRVTPLNTHHRNPVIFALDDRQFSLRVVVSRPFYFLFFPPCAVVCSCVSHVGCGVRDAEMHVFASVSLRTYVSCVSSLWQCNCVFACMDMCAHHLPVFFVLCGCTTARPVVMCLSHQDCASSLRRSRFVLAPTTGNAAVDEEGVELATVNRLMDVMVEYVSLKHAVQDNINLIEEVEVLLVSIAAVDSWCSCCRQYVSAFMGAIACYRQCVWTHSWEQLPMFEPIHWSTCIGDCDVFVLHPL